MLKIKVRRMTVVEEELGLAAEEALRMVIPIEKEGSAGDRAVLRPVDSKKAQNTEQRWLGRMVTNTLGEIQSRVELYDSKSAMLKAEIESEKEEVQKLSESKKRKLAEVASVKEKVEAVRKKVLSQQGSQCMQEAKALRPAEDSAEEEKEAVMGEDDSEILKQVPSLQKRAKQCVEEMGVSTEQLGERIESFRETAGAVSSFLQTKPSKVEQAIRQSHRRGEGMDQGATVNGGSGKNGDSKESKATSTKKNAARASPATSTSAISMLSQHLAPAPQS